MATAAASCFGVANFFGGQASKRDTALAVTANAHMLGTVLLGLAALLFPARAPEAVDIVWGAVAGMTSGFAVVALYAGLAIGRMSVVAPVTAAVSAALPALYDLAGGTVLRPVTGAGIVLALFAVIIVSAATDEESRAAMPLRATALAVLAGIAFSGTLLAFSFCGAESGFVPLVSARFTSATILGLLTVLRRRRYLVDPAARGFATGSGMLDSLANIALITALRVGPLAVVAVLGAMHPVITILLARKVLGERLRGAQRVGVAIALVAVVMTALP